MKEKILINARIIDPSQGMDEKGSVLIDDKGKIKSIGKNVKIIDAPTAEVVDIKNHVVIPGIVDMKAFVGEPGYEYKENFRTLSQAALAGGVTSVVTMPNTKPIIDNVLARAAFNVCWSPLRVQLHWPSSWQPVSHPLLLPFLLLPRPCLSMP